MSILFACIAAPLWYCILGLLWSGWFGEDRARLWLSPLFGIVLSGWVGELALMLSLPYEGVLVALWLVSLGAACKRAPVWGRIKPVVILYLAIYAFGLATVAAAPFPVLGPWSGDWFVNIQFGDAVRTGVYRPELVGRTPFYGGGGSWLGWFAPRLPSAQCHSAAVAAGAVLVLQFWRAIEGKPIFRASTLTLLLASCFFLQHVAMSWAKFLSAACVLVSLAELYRIQVGSLRFRFVAGSFWFAAAVAAHPSAVIFAPLILWAAFKNFAWDWKEVLRFGGILAAFGLILPLAFELWTITVFGIDAKVTNNPTVYYRESGASVAQTAMAVFAGVFIPDFTYWLEIWRDGSLPPSLAGFATRIYFTFINWVSASAGSLFLSAVPFWPLAPSAIAGLRSSNHKTVVDRWLIAAVLAVLVLHAILTPYAAPHGSMAAGTVPIGFMAAYLVLTTFQDFGSRSQKRRTSVSVILLSALPWYALNIAVTAALAVGGQTASTSMWDKLNKHESDAPIVLHQGLVSMGLYAFPWIFIFASIVFVCLATFFDRRFNSESPCRVRRFPPERKYRRIG